MSAFGSLCGVVRLRGPWGGRWIVGGRVGRQGGGVFWGGASLRISSLPAQIVADLLRRLGAVAISWFIFPSGFDRFEELQNYIKGALWEGVEIHLAREAYSSPELAAVDSHFYILPPIPACGVFFGWGEDGFLLDLKGQRWGGWKIDSIPHGQN
ncbi:MAG: hypothetical protein IPG87_12015 [Saprospiraceae bacterium]|nr:hypothetical protein [Candidatus Vicinibacter affinis]